MIVKTDLRPVKSELAELAGTYPMRGCLEGEEAEMISKMNKEVQCLRQSPPNYRARVLDQRVMHVNPLHTFALTHSQPETNAKLSEENAQRTPYGKLCHIKECDTGTEHRYTKARCPP